MLLTALKLQLAALVSVAGINTDDISSKDVKDLLTTLESIQKDVAAGKSKVDINQASTDTVKKVADLSEKGDADAMYAMALWSRMGILNGATQQQLLDWYTKAADKGQVSAEVELGSLLISNFPQDAEKAGKGLDYIKKAEAANNSAARRALAQLTLVGVPAAKHERNLDAALALYQKGSDAKDGEATFSLSQIYTLGIQEKNGEETKTLLAKDAKKGLALLEKASNEQNFAPAMSLLADRLLIGDEASGLKADPARALDILNKAAKDGSAAAERQLGQIFENGLGGQKKDIKSAAEHYAKAANGNDGVAQLWLGNAAQNGVLSDKGVEKAKAAQGKPASEQPKLEADDIVIQPSPAGALNMYRLAAQNNQPLALYYVGLFYENGAVVDKDANKAFALVQRAAQSNIPAAQFKLASYYQNGVGVAQDVVAAAGWYQRSAEAGLPQGKLVYGAMLENGVGVPRSATAAEAAYLSASADGLAQASISLASLYYRGGEGVKSSKERAWVYASIAVDQSNKDPKAVDFRDKLEKEMSDKEKSDAKKTYEAKKADDEKKGSAPAAAAPSAPAATPDKPGTGAKKKK